MWEGDFAIIRKVVNEKSNRNGKHVIFLGAGASMSSGYPSADGLRLLLTSPDRLTDYLAKRFSVNSSALDWLHGMVSQRREPFKEGLELFRRGGFASVDEFCFLANGAYSKEVRAVRTYMCLVLAYVMPERTFHQSEYYRFAQKLFDHDLRTPRSDVSILTYNYDPYLEFLLTQFYAVRNQAVDSGAACLPPAGLMSGFCGYGRPLSQETGCCVLKLHGSVGFLHHTATGDCRPLEIEELMAEGPKDFPGKIFNWKPCDPGPVVFPWELFDTAGNLRPIDDCRWNLKTGWPAIPGKETFYDLLAETWKRARIEVQQARKVSFVGLSMHSYLEDGMKYLFKDRIAPFQWVVANPLATDKTGNSPVKAFERTLRTAAPMAFDVTNAEPKCLDGFREFIEFEMNPLPAR